MFWRFIKLHWCYEKIQIISDFHFDHELFAGD